MFGFAPLISYRHAVVVFAMHASAGASIRSVSEAVQHNAGLLSECVLPGVGQKVLSATEALVAGIPNHIRAGWFANSTFVECPNRPIQSILFFVVDIFGISANATTTASKYRCGATVDRQHQFQPINSGSDDRNHTHTHTLWGLDFCDIYCSIS